jgi:hypothetical protein
MLIPAGHRVVAGNPQALKTQNPTKQSGPNDCEDDLHLSFAPLFTPGSFPVT